MLFKKETTGTRSKEDIRWPFTCGIRPSRPATNGIRDIARKLPLIEPISDMQTENVIK